MSNRDRFPRLNAVEQEVLLCAIEGEDLFHVVWGIRGAVATPERTDDELRPEAEASIRKLIDLGWVLLVQSWSDPAPQGSETPEIFGRRHKVDFVERHESIPAGQFDDVLRDPSSWKLDGPYRVALTTTPEGDAANAGGVLDDAYEKIAGPKARVIQDRDSS